MSYYQGTPEEPHMDFDKGVEAAADAGMAFARYLANQQGAADTGTMRTFWNAVQARCEERQEEEMT